MIVSRGLFGSMELSTYTIDVWIVLWIYPVIEKKQFIGTNFQERDV